MIYIPSHENTIVFFNRFQKRVLTTPGFIYNVCCESLSEKTYIIISTSARSSYDNLTEHRLNIYCFSLNESLYKPE